MDTHQKYQSHFITFFGMRSGVGVTTLAVNVAVILGVVARCRTLLLDLSGDDDGLVHHLGISSNRGLLSLTTPFLKENCISTDELAGQVVHYEPGPPWPAGVSALDVLPGFDRVQLSPAEKQRLSGYYGIALAKAVCESARLTGYEFVLADGGVWLKERIGFGMFGDSGRAFLVSSSEAGDVLRVEPMVREMRGVGWRSLVIFNQIQKWRFEYTYQHESSLNSLNCKIVPPTKTEHLTECRVRGVPAALFDLQRAKRHHDGFVSALIGVASEANRQLKDKMLDCQGRSIR